MTDLAAQIRATLDAWAQPVAILEHPEPLTEAEYADLVARFLAAQQGPNVARIVESPTVTPPFEPMRDALAAVLDAHPPTGDGSGVRTVCGTCCGPSESWERLALPYPCPTVAAIAAKLGIEVASDD